MARKYLKAAGIAAMVLGGSFAPAQAAFTLGWNSARCGDSLWYGLAIFALNDNGQDPLVALSSLPADVLTSAQNELLLACENGAPGYFVLINNIKTDNFIHLLINMRGATPPPSPPAELSALIKPNTNGTLPKNELVQPKAAPRSAFINGWNIEKCSQSQWALYNGVYYVTVKNEDGTGLISASASAVANLTQIQLVEACRATLYGEFYYVHVNLSTNTFDQIRVTGP